MYMYVSRSKLTQDLEDAILHVAGTDIRPSGEVEGLPLHKPAWTKHKVSLSDFAGRNIAESLNRYGSLKLAFRASSLCSGLNVKKYMAL